MEPCGTPTFNTFVEDFSLPIDTNCWRFRKYDANHLMLYREQPHVLSLSNRID